MEMMTSLGLVTLQHNLPEVLREKVPENQASWTLLMNAIKGIELEHIREGVRKYKERAAEAEKVQAQITLLEQCTASNAVLLNSLTKPIHNHLSRTTISQPVTIRTNPFSGNNGDEICLHLGLEISKISDCAPFLEIFPCSFGESTCCSQSPAHISIILQHCQHSSVPFS